MESGTHPSEMKNIIEIPFLLAKNKIPRVFPSNKRLILFLDYDGTLSPIVNKPEMAFMAEGIKEALEKCASIYTTAIVSGRDTDDVRRRVGIDGIIYAGSHGFSIKGPGNLNMEHEKSGEILPLLSRIEKALLETFSNGPEGVQIERKKYAITVHYRNADADAQEQIIKMAEQAIAGFSGIKKEAGKKIVEIKPDIEWHKGMAVKWILEKLALWDDPGIFPVYVGDDITDEDAFRILHGKGMGILVGSHDDELTAADYRLKDADEVKVFLEIIAAKD